MIEFDYSLDYKSLDFTEDDNRHLYRIGRGEQGVLLVQPYSAQLCLFWRFNDFFLDFLDDWFRLRGWWV